MSDRQAIKVISEMHTDFGYVIRREIWPGVSFSVETPEDADETTLEIVDTIAGAHGPAEMETCYTYSGDWIGNLEVAKRLCNERGIAPEHPNGPMPGILQPCCIGFSAREQKWYGWSHRAIFGFGIGSTVKKGDCAYVPGDWSDLIESAIMFWSDEYHTETTAKRGIDPDGVDCINVSWGYNNSVPNKKLRGTTSGTVMYPPKTWGRGEWTAASLVDAKQMAIDFADGVS